MDEDFPDAASSLDLVKAGAGGNRSERAPQDFVRRATSCLQVTTLMFRPIVAAAALTALVLQATPTVAPAQGNTTSLGTIKPQYTRKTSKIVVLPFNVTGASVEMDTFPRIVRNDLQLSGLFEVIEPSAAARQILVDETASNEFYADRWSALSAEYVLRGMVRETPDGKFRIVVNMHDVASGALVFNMRTFEAQKTNLRGLAHMISDAVMDSTKSVEGIFQTRLLFVSEKVRGTKEIGIMDADGFNQAALTNYGRIATGPVWGARGGEFYFTSYHRNRAIIYGQQLSLTPSFTIVPTGQAWEIAAHGGTNHSPAWSPTAGRLAVVLSKDGNSELYTTDRSGKDLRRLTTTAFTEGSPTWSPDGTRIAYTSNEAGGVHLFLMNASGGGRTRLTTRGSWNDAVSWSPKGDRVAFVSREGGTNDIYTYDLTTKAYRRLTQAQGNNESPVWAPNGVHIAFSSNRSGTWQVYMMLDDGSGQMQLTSSGRNTQPDWGPGVR